MVRTARRIAHALEGITNVPHWMEAALAKRGGVVLFVLFENVLNIYMGTNARKIANASPKTRKGIFPIFLLWN